MAKYYRGRPGAARAQAGRVEPADLVADGAAGRAARSAWSGSRAAATSARQRRDRACRVGAAPLPAAEAA